MNIFERNNRVPYTIPLSDFEARIWSRDSTYFRVLAYFELFVGQYDALCDYQASDRPSGCNRNCLVTGRRCTVQGVRSKKESTENDEEPNFHRSQSPICSEEQVVPLEGLGRVLHSTPA